MRGIASHSTPRTSCNIQHRLTSRFLSRSSSLTAPWATIGWGVTVDAVGLAAIIGISSYTGWKLIEVRISEFRLRGFWNPRVEIHP